MAVNVILDKFLDQKIKIQLDWKIEIVRSRNAKHEKVLTGGQLPRVGKVFSVIHELMYYIRFQFKLLYSSSLLNNMIH